MASPQPDRFVKISNELWDEVIRRDFSKRQKDIIMFVWRLSYGCQLKSACIPKMKDFELCGVPATQVKKELEYLEECNVLLWNREETIFQINKDYEKWSINPVKNWKKDRFKELIHQNVERQKTSQNMKLDFMKHEVEEEENFTKHEEGTSQNVNENFIKREVLEPAILTGTKVEEGSKDSKDIIKDIKDLNNSSLDTMQSQDTGGQKPPPDFSFENLYRIFTTHFITDHTKLEIPTEIFGDLFDTYGGEAVYTAFREAAKHEKYFLPYVESILRGKPRSERGNDQRTTAGPAVPTAEQSRTRIDEIKEARRRKQEFLAKRAAEGISHGT